MTKTTKDEILGFKNFDKWMKGYDVHYKWLDDGLKRIQNNQPLHDMGSEERKKYLHNVAFSLVSGAIDLQFIGKHDFYIDNQDMEVLIRYKKTYSGMKKEEITFSLMKDVILLLEKEESQLRRIANAYDE